MKVKNKYDWKIGQQPPVLEQHSQIKHRILGDYIQDYIATLMKNPRIDQLRLTLVDGFSGGGKYRHELTGKPVDGSPFVIMKAVQAAEAALNLESRKSRRVISNFHFVEKEPNYLQYLKETLNASEFKDKLEQQNIHFYCSQFAAAAPNVIQRIRQDNAKQRTIFVLDQFGYKDVPLPTVKSIFNQLQNAEVILTFNFETLMAFLSDSHESRKVIANMGLNAHIDLTRIEALKEAGCYQQAIQEQLSQGIWKESGAQHITLFFISPFEGWTYWLVHLSNVYRARDVMMKLHWKQSNDFQHHLEPGIFRLGYNAKTDVGYRGQLALNMNDRFGFDAIARKKCVDTLSHDVPEFICLQDSVCYGDLLNQIGSSTPASEEHILAALRNSIDSREVRIEGPDKKIKTFSTLKTEDRLIYHQPRLFSF